MVRAVIVACLLLKCYRKILAENWNTTIFVSPQGNDNSGCGDEANPCQSVNFVFSSSVCFNSTRIKLQAGNYTLKRTYDFKWLHDFALVGKHGSPEEVTIECNQNASLAFVLSERITLEDFILQGCGGWHLGTQSTINMNHFLKSQTALYLNYCNDIEISRIHMIKSQGKAITFYDIGGVLKLEDCLLIDNVPGHISNTTSEDYALAGGGIFLELTEEGSNPLGHPGKHHMLQISNNSYSVARCQFFRNKTPRQSVPSLLKLYSFPFVNGGGLAIWVANKARSNEINVRYCEFTGNEAGWGGAIHVFLPSASSNNSINITNTTFESNTAIISGGGVNFSQSKTVDLTKSEIPNQAFFDNCSFLNNTAFWGGGFSVFGATHIKPTARNKAIYFRNCRWIGNYGTVGSAVSAMVYNLNENGVGPLIPYSLIFEDCLFVHNMLQPSVTKEAYPFGLGAIYTMQVPITFVGNTTIADNDQSSLALDSANVGIHGKTVFRNNTGYKGGAVVLYGRSSIVLFEDSQLYFIENHCQMRGGAMYVTGQGSPITRFKWASFFNPYPCFFLYKNRYVPFNHWKIKIVFRGNTASSKNSGNSVFASTLANCRLPGEPLINNSVLHWPFVTFLDSHGNKTDVASEVSTEPVDIVSDSKEWSRAPGEIFTPSVKLFDELWNPGRGVVQVSVKAKGKSDYINLTTSPFFLIESGHLDNIRIAGKENVQFEVKLMTVCGPILKRYIHNASLLRCNSGFRVDGDVCVCDSQPGIAGCSKSGRDVYIRRGYWAGFVGKDFVTSPCPNSYCADCANLKNTSLPKDTCLLFQKNKMCAKNRDGSSILCGRCQSGYSVELANSVCSKCSNLYLLLIIPYAIVLLLLVMAIMAINLDAFTGYLNAWLYSYQVMSLLTKREMQFDAFLNSIIGFAQLQIKLPSIGVCLADNMNEEDVLMISYIPPTYVLLLVFILAKVVRRYPDWIYSKRVRAPFRALCTILVLCYTTMTGISLKMLHLVPVGDKLVLYQDGEIEFFKNTKHILYGTVAICYIAVIVIPFPLFLMFTPFFVKKINKYLHINLNRFKPIYDTLQSCFEEEYRWFSAFYFVNRFLLVILATLVPTETLRRFLIEITCIIVLALFLYFRPYKQAKATDRKEEREEKDFDWINKSDAVLLTNLCLIAVASSSLDVGTARLVVNVLGYVPLIVMISVLWYRVVRNRCRPTKLIRAEDTDTEQSSDFSYLSSI